jgi:L-lactate utilization protein LutC
LEFVEQIQQIYLSEETKPRIQQDEVEQNRDLNASTMTTVPELSKEEIKEETQNQEENNINDSCSVSAIVVSEEAVLKEAEPETIEEIKSSENKEIYEEDQVGLGFKFCALKMTSYAYSTICTNPLMTLSLSVFYFNRNLRE